MVLKTLAWLRHWLYDWGDLLLTFVIALAGVGQWLVAKRLYALQRALEDSKRRVSLFSRITANMEHAKTFAQLQISNLSGFPVWLESISHVYTLDGEQEERSLGLNVQEVLDVGKTFRTMVSGNIQNFLKSEETTLQPGLTPISCTVRTQVNYWADGIAGQTTTPQYHMEVSKDGLQVLRSKGHSPTASYGQIKVTM